MELWMAKLTALKVKNAKPGKYGDGEGLQLAVSKSGSKQWVLRYQWQNKAREMGLGGYPVVSLDEAREKARAARKLAKSGIDPITQARHDSSVPTFGALADRVLADVASSYRNKKHIAQWRMTLTEYAAPLRSLPVDQIETSHVLSVLRPLWSTTPETADRLRGRIEKVLNSAKALGHRTGENPAQWRGHLDNLLPPRKKGDHHNAMPYPDVPQFMQRLRQHPSIAACALRFTILTAARSGEALGACWSEIDLTAGVWTVPADRMKSSRPHRVPLSGAALGLLRPLYEMRTSDFVFPGQRKDAPLSSMVKALKIIDPTVTVHGFRSSFRDWAGNETEYARELAEAALAHVIGDKAEQAYRRSDALERRRAMMEDWAVFCESRIMNEPPETSA
jgi:integrase